MRKMPEIKAENGFVISIDGNVIPRTKLYAHYIVLRNADNDKCCMLLIDDNPNSYKEDWIGDKYDNLNIPCFGLKVVSGKVYQYTEFRFSPSTTSVRYATANIETNKIDERTDYLYGSFVKSDTVTPLN